MTEWGCSVFKAKTHKSKTARLISAFQYVKGYVAELPKITNTTSKAGLKPNIGFQSNVDVTVKVSSTKLEPNTTTKVMIQIGCHQPKIINPLKKYAANTPQTLQVCAR